MADTIQRQIINALAVALKCSIHDRESDMTLIDGGHSDITYQYGVVQKTLDVTVEAKTLSEALSGTDNHATLMMLYGQILTDAQADETLGGLCVSINEAAPSPLLDIREAGAETIGLRVGLAILYRHNKGDPFTQE